MKNMTDVFNALKEANHKYVMVSDWDSLPNSYKSPMTILTADADRLRSLLGLTRIEGARHLLTMERYTVTLFVRQKGTGFLPEKFESELLERTNINNECVRVPDEYLAFYMMAYIWTYHQDRFTNEHERRVICRVLDERVGPPVRPRDTDIELKFTRRVA